MTTTEINWDALHEETDPRFSGVKVRTASAKALRIKVANRNPQKPDVPFEPGLVVKDAEAGVSLVQSIDAVILLYSHTRSLFAGKKGLLCSSDDGHAPSLKHKEPLCKKATTAEIAAILKGFKGMEEARLTDLTGQLTEGGDHLLYCGIAKTDGTIIPMCPMARRDELGGTAKCKPAITLAGVERGTGRKFYLSVSGSSIRRDKESTAPLWQFLEFLGEKEIPVYNVSVTLTTKKTENGVYVLDVTNVQPLPEEERKLYKPMALRELEMQERRMCTATAPKAELVEKTLAEKTATMVAEVFDDDDIQFG